VFPPQSLQPQRRESGIRFRALSLTRSFYLLGLIVNGLNLCAALAVALMANGAPTTKGLEAFERLTENSPTRCQVWVAGRAGVGENAIGATGPLPSVPGTITGADRFDGRRKAKTQFDWREGLCTSVMVFGGALEGEPLVGVPGCCGAYFDAHLACSALA
jgi:hypothetical protein